MAKKILLASGCSFTDSNFKSLDTTISEEQRSGWPMWPELMANELGLKCVNRGRSGGGADHILNSIIEEIATHGNKVDTVAILWSGCDRWPLFDVNLNPFTSLLENAREGELSANWERLYNIETLVSDLWDSPSFGSSIYKTMIHNQLTKICAIMDICKANNIKLIMNQGIPYFSQWHLDFLFEKKKLTKKQYITKSTVVHAFISNDLFSKIDAERDNIIGWPFFSDLGGSCWDGRRRDLSDTYVSNKDRHPNALGQTLLAKEFIEKHNELYSV